MPAPAIEALERIAAHRQGCDLSHQQRFTAIANCGFPEAHHCTTALAIEGDLRRRGYTVLFLFDNIPQGGIGYIYEAMLEWAAHRAVAEQDL